MSNRFGAFDGDLRQRNAIGLFDEELLQLGRFDRQIIEGALWSASLSGYLDADGFGAETLTAVLLATGVSDADLFGTESASLRTAQSGLLDPDSAGVELVSIAIHEAGYVDPDSFGAALITDIGAASGLSDADSFGALLGSAVFLPLGYSDPDLFGSGILSVRVAETGFDDPDFYGSLQLVPVGTLSGLSDADQFGSAFVSLTLHGTGYSDQDLFGLLVWPHRSERRRSRLRPHSGSIARAQKVNLNGVVADMFRVIVTDEPADIQDRSGSYFQQDVGRIVQRRMVGYFDTASGLAIKDRFVTATETFLVLHLAEKSKQIQADLERVSS